MTETEKIMRKVLKKAPTAKMLFDSEKNLYIDVDGVNLSEEHLLPPARDDDVTMAQDTETSATDSEETGTISGKWKNWLVQRSNPVAGT